MKKAAKKVLPAHAHRLTQDDWLDAAFAAVAEGGFDKARVLSLAAALGVTRGSFYWHFSDHATLIEALLARWRDRELAEIKRLETGDDKSAEQDLDDLLEAALAHAGTDLRLTRFELALRGLGRRDPAVANMLLQIDQLRMALFQNKFKRLTGDEKKATELSVVFYLAIVGGHQALSRPNNSPHAKAYFKELIATYLIRAHRSPDAKPERKKKPRTTD